MEPVIDHVIPLFDKDLKRSCFQINSVCYLLAIFLFILLIAGLAEHLTILWGIATIIFILSTICGISNSFCSQTEYLIFENETQSIYIKTHPYCPCDCIGKCFKESIESIGKYDDYINKSNPIKIYLRKDDDNDVMYLRMDHGMQKGRKLFQIPPDKDNRTQCKRMYEEIIHEIDIDFKLLTAARDRKNLAEIHQDSTNIIDAYAALYSETIVADDVLVLILNYYFEGEFFDQYDSDKILLSSDSLQITKFSEDSWDNTIYGWNSFKSTSDDRVVWRFYVDQCVGDKGIIFGIESIEQNIGYAFQNDGTLVYDDIESVSTGKGVRFGQGSFVRITIDFYRNRVVCDVDDTGEVRLYSGIFASPDVEYNLMVRLYDKNTSVSLVNFSVHDGRPIVPKFKW